MVAVAAVAAWLGQVLGRTVEVRGAARMQGGAIQHNWALDAVVDGVPDPLVLRTDAPSSLDVSRSRPEEYAILRAAFAAGAAVPEPLALCGDAAVTGRPFFVMRRVAGIAAGHLVVRRDDLGGGREALAGTLGRELARIHSIRPPRPDLAFLHLDPRPPAARFIAEQRASLDRAGEHRPVLEWGLRHLERTIPGSTALVLCHNDFRTGNLMVNESGVTGVLDWEFAAWGDRLEDIGWFCARCWRFGSAHEAGGIGSRAAFYAGYEAESGHLVPRDDVGWWEMAATIRWAVIALDQAARHRSGRERNLELALTGHVVPELEWDVLRMTGHA